MQKSEERLQLAYIFTTNVMNPHHSLSKKRIVIMHYFFWFFYLLNIHDILCLYHLSIGEVNVNIFFKWFQLQYLFTPTFPKVTRKNIKKWWAISSINPNDLESPYKLHFSHHNALKLIRMINFSHHVLVIVNIPLVIFSCDFNGQLYMYCERKKDRILFKNRLTRI